MNSSWITYKGNQILLVDYRNLSGQALISTLEEAYQTVLKAPGKVLVLNDFTGASIDPTFMARAKEIGQPKGERKSAKTAAIGIGGLKTILMQGYNRTTGAGIMPFDTREEALEWLVQDES